MERKFCIVGILVGLFGVVSNGQLSVDYYTSSCSSVIHEIVGFLVYEAVNRDPRMGASLLRLHFHDCFVTGCDGSILLDDTPNFIGEKTAAPNLNSVRGFEVIDEIKLKVEEVCPGVVSCADILALAAHYSVVELGGPTWKVPLGRRDSKTANKIAANNDIPPPTSNLSSLISRFSSKGLSAKDLVALSGAHTIGVARCTGFRSRIYNESNIDAEFAKMLRQKCPSTIERSNTISSLDVATPACFDNSYYSNLLSEKGLLHSDQELMKMSSTAAVVDEFAREPFLFFKEFAEAMVKMGNIQPLTGKRGEIRSNCRKVN